MITAGRVTTTPPPVGERVRDCCVPRAPTGGAGLAGRPDGYVGSGGAARPCAGGAVAAAAGRAVAIGVGGRASGPVGRAGTGVVAVVRGGGVGGGAGFWSSGGTWNLPLSRRRCCAYEPGRSPPGSGADAGDGEWISTGADSSSGTSTSPPPAICAAPSSTMIAV